MLILSMIISTCSLLNPPDRDPMGYGLDVCTQQFSACTLESGVFKARDYYVTRVETPEQINVLADCLIKILRKR